MKRLQADLASARANESAIRAKLDAKVGDDMAEVAQVRAQLAQAQWELEQTTLYAPADGYAINVQIRPGAMTAAFPALPVMTFVESEYQVIALFAQNELHAIEPGDEAEFTLLTYPGQIIKAARRLDRLGAGSGSGRDQQHVADDRHMRRFRRIVFRSSSRSIRSIKTCSSRQAPSATVRFTRSTSKRSRSCARSFCASARSSTT